MLNRIRKICTGILVLSFLFLPIKAGFAAVENLRTGITSDRVRLVVNMDKPFAVKEKVLGPRLVVEIPTKAAKTERVLVRDPLIRRAYLEPYGNISRLVVFFSKPVPEHKIFLVKNPTRLVIDIPREKKPAQEPQTPSSNVLNLGQGLTYRQETTDMGAGDVNAYVLEMKPNSAFKLNFIPGYGNTIQKGTLSKIVERSGAVAAVNASYFDSSIWVIGNLEINKKFLGAEPTPRTALVLGPGNKIQIIPQIAYQGTVTAENGKKAEITGINRMRLTDDLIYFNDGYDTDTGTNAYGMEVKVRNGKVVEMSAKGSMALDSSSYVLSGNGQAAGFLKTLRVGDTVKVDHYLGNSDAEAADSVGSVGPLLVNNGRVQVESTAEGIASDIAYGRAPRTGIGIKSDGTVLVVVADGRSNDSVGMSLTELAKYFVNLGAETAMNFDGGGSSEMVVNGDIMNTPSDGDERPIRVALGIFRK
jgi:exopolysaccharide biosynthesis protein